MLTGSSLARLTLIHQKIVSMASVLTSTVVPCRHLKINKSALNLFCFRCKIKTNYLCEEGINTEKSIESDKKLITELKLKFLNCYVLLALINCCRSLNITKRIKIRLGTLKCVYL